MTPKPMLTRLHFQNWRSLRQVTLEDLTPITVLVGANSSGKTNVVDGLRFARQAIQDEIFGLQQAISNSNGEKNIRTLGSTTPVEIELDFQSDGEIHGCLFRLFDSIASPPPSQKPLNITDFVSPSAVEKGATNHSKVYFNQTGFAPLKKTVTQHWQILAEDFAPPTRTPHLGEGTDYLRIHPTAANLPDMLDFIHQYHPEIYAELESDLVWLLGHVQALETVRDERETRFLIREKPLSDAESPTVSGGTRRILAMLTAYYALAMRDADQPGLLVIEEPDHGVHPLLLGNLVSLFRGYTQNPDRPRQIILTTHNPILLNLFKPDEVRVVERDEQGETTIQKIDPDVARVWFEQDGAHNLGDLWTTRLVGGVPE